jgi:hypothetical protein
MRLARIPVRVRLFGVLTIVMLAAALVVVPLRDGGGIAAAAPHNDDFNRAAFLVIDAPVTQSTAGATLQAGETAPCADIGASVWFEFRPPARGTYVIDAVGSDFDVVLTVYTPDNFFPSPPGESITPAACNAGADTPARAEFFASGEREYYIQAAGLGGATGNLRLAARCSPACPPPSDSIGYAHGNAVRSLPFTAELDTSGATLEPGEFQPCGDIGRTVWFHLHSRGIEEITVTASTEGNDFPTAIAVWTGVPSPPNGFAPTDCTTEGSVSFALPPNTPMFVQVGGVDGAGGNLRLHLTCNFPSCMLIPQPIPVETGDGAIPAPGGGPVLPPVTGTGGYLPSRGR